MNYSYLDKKEEFGKVNTFLVYAQKKNKQDLGYYVQGRGGNYFCSDMNLPTAINKVMCAKNSGLCPLGYDRPNARYVFYNDGKTYVGQYGTCQDKVAGQGDDGEIGGKIFCSDGTNNVDCCPGGYTLRAGNINGRTQLICDSKAPAPPPPSPHDKKWYCVNSNKQDRLCECAQYSTWPYDSQGNICDSSKYPYDTQELCKNACKAKDLYGCMSCKVNT